MIVKFELEDENIGWFNLQGRDKITGCIYHITRIPKRHSQKKWDGRVIGPVPPLNNDYRPKTFYSEDFDELLELLRKEYKKLEREYNKRKSL